MFGMNAWDNETSGYAVILQWCGPAKLIPVYNCIYVDILDTIYLDISASFSSIVILFDILHIV